MKTNNLICDFCDKPITSNINIMWCEDCNAAHNMCDTCYVDGNFKDMDRPMNSLKDRDKYV